MTIDEFVASRLKILQSKRKQLAKYFEPIVKAEKVVQKGS
jgi:hypothetical protein